VRTRPVLWLVVLGALASTLAFAVWRVGEGPEHGPSRAVARRLPAPAATLPASDVLHEWDGRRAAAFARGDEVALRRLYVPGSTAGTSDVALLRAYDERGLRVRGMRMQLLAVRVLARGPRTWRLEVTDRLVGAVAVTHGRRYPLPRDRASTRVVELRLLGDRWRVASVTDRA
jgi:hypothetical protein